MTEEWPDILLPALLERGMRIGAGTTSSAPRLDASTVVFPPSGFSSHHLRRHRREVPLGEQSAESPFRHVQSFVAVRASRRDDGCVVGTVRVVPRLRPTGLLPPASSQSLRLSTGNPSFSSSDAGLRRTHRSSPPLRQCTRRRHLGTDLEQGT